GLLEEPQYAFEAARALGRAGHRAAVRPLVRLLHRSGNAPVRLAAQALSDLRERHGELYGTQEPIVEAILQADPERSCVRRLLQALSGADASEQAAICTVLGALGGEDSVRALTQLLDGAAGVARAAAEELQRLGRAADPQLLRLLGDGDSARLALQAAPSSSAAVRQSALKILSYLGDTSAVPIFLESLRDPDPRVRDAAVQGLAFLEDPRAKEALFAAVRDASERTRASAARALGAGTSDARGIAHLLKALGDPAPWVRYYACQ